MDHAYYSNDPTAPKRKKVDGTYCSVPQCSSRTQIGISFHKYPKDAKYRKDWQIALKTGKKPTDSMRVCSKHFLPSDYIPTLPGRRSLKSIAVPSQNLPTRSHDKVISSPLKKQREARKRRAEKRKQVDQGRVIHESDEPNPVIIDPELTSRNTLEAEKITEVTGNEAPKVKSVETQVNMPACKCHSKLKPEKITLVDILTDSDVLYTFTGVRSYDILNTIVENLEDILPISQTRQKDLQLKDRVLLTLIRIKLNISFKALGALFGIKRQTCANYFYNMCPLIRVVLDPLISLPDQSYLRENLPLTFDMYRYTRIVLDCAETRVERSKCLKCRILTYSQYKKGHTIKWLIGVSPSGLIIFISKVYGGRASDKFIVDDSGVLDKLDMNDGVMVDKGFRIDKECAQRGLKLLRPPFLIQKQQLSFEDAIETANIARARVHVERVIQRVREFELIAGPVPWTFVPYFEDCLIIASALTNLSPPVMNIDKFL